MAEAQKENASGVEERISENEPGELRIFLKRVGDGGEHGLKSERGGGSCTRVSLGSSASGSNRLKAERRRERSSGGLLKNCRKGNGGSWCAAVDTKKTPTKIGEKGEEEMEGVNHGASSGNQDLWILTLGEFSRRAKERNLRVVKKTMGGGGRGLDPLFGAEESSPRGPWGIESDVERGT